MTNSTAFEFSAQWGCPAVSALDGPHGWVGVQAIPLIAGVLALLLVRHVDRNHERAVDNPTRAEYETGCLWALDSVKLLCGQTLLGVINLAGAIQLRDSTAPVPGDRSVSDLCCWYLVGVLVNTFVGMPLSYCGVRAVEIAGAKLEDSSWGRKTDFVATCGAATSQSGMYGDPPSCPGWILQVALWMGVVTVANVVPMAFIQLVAPLHRLAARFAADLGNRTYGTGAALMLCCVVILVRTIRSIIPCRFLLLLWHCAQPLPVVLLKLLLIAC
jgi:hypothetical protein